MAFKIAFIGAGSFGFTRTLVRDILTHPRLADATLSLMDIDPQRLAFIRRAVDRIVKEGRYPARVESTQDRAKALEGADAVLVTILAGGVKVWRHDIEIPKRYGVDINVGDTRGPSGIFRALRTIPVMLGIARDVERLAPRAILLNYTNPMAMLCRALQRETKVKVTGLCHSVQGTAMMLAKWIGAPYEEIVRNEMFRHLGYYVTESSGHNSEYNAWFRKRADLIEKYCAHGTGWNPGRYGFTLQEYEDRDRTWKSDIEAWLSNPEPLDLKRGKEYAASIINAYAGGEPFRFNGNVANEGLIDNLPRGACVEVPVYADRQGFQAVHVGSLPAQCAALNNTSVAVEEMAVEACLSGNPTTVFHSVCYDPLTSAVLSLAEIRQMVDEMLEKNRDYLPTFSKFKA